MLGCGISIWRIRKMEKFDSEWLIARVGGCEKAIELLDNKIVILEKRIKKLQDDRLQTKTKREFG